MHELRAGNRFWFAAGPALVGLSIAAKITGSAATISDMANMVGWGTFAVEHVVALVA